MLKASFRALRASLLTLLALAAASATAPRLLAQRHMEELGRGVVAVRPNSTSVYVGWRLLGDEPTNLGFNVYRTIGGGAATKLNASPITGSTNYLDTPPSSAFGSTTTYRVAPVRDGVEQPLSAPFTLSAAAYQQFISLPLSTAYPNPASGSPYNVKFCWVGDFDGDGEYDFLVDRVPTDGEDRQYLEAYLRDGTFLWRMDMGPNSVNQYAYEPGSSAISIGDTDNVTVYDLDGDGRAEVLVRTANGVSVTNAAGDVVATITAANNSSQFVSVIDGLGGAELARAALPNPWSQHGTLTNKCAIAYLDGARPSVLFYGYNRADSGAFYRVFSTFDYRDGSLTLRWSTPQTFAGAEGHQIRVADVDNDGRDEIIDIGHVIDDDGTQLFVIPEISHGDRFHVADIDPDRPGLENYIIQQNNPSFLATALYDAGTGEIIKKWYSTSVVDVGRGIALDLTSAHKGYEMFSTQGGIFNARGDQIQSNGFFPYEALWWDGDLLREIIAAADGNGFNPIINKYNQTNGGMDRLWSIYSDFGSFVNRTAYGGRPAFWGDILGDWREELIFVTSDHASLRIYTPTGVATNRFYTLMHNPAYRMQATTKGYVQASYVDYYLGADMPAPPPPPMVRADLRWAGGPGLSTWNDGATSAWIDEATGAAATFTAGRSVRFDLQGNAAASVALSGTLAPGEVTVYSPTDYTFDGSAGSLAGATRLVKAGKGSLRVTGAHAFTGATTVWDGALRVDGSLTGSPVTVWGGTWGGAPARGLTGGRLTGSGTLSQAVSLQNRGAISPGAGTGSAGTLTLGNGLTAADGSALVLDLSSDPSGLSLPNDHLAITGNLGLSGTVSVVINPLSGQLAPGTYTLATYSGALTGSAANIAMVLPEGVPHTFALGAGKLTLTIPVTRAPGNVTWTGTVSGVWDLAGSANWRLGGSPEVFVSGDSVTFDETGSTRPSITLDQSVSMGGMSVSGAGSYSIGGTGSIGGVGGLAKSGAGTLTLNTTNSFTGPVNVTGGVLAVANLADGDQPSSIGASSAAATNFVLNGGTLRLTGSQTNTNRALTLGADGGTIDTPVTFQISGGITGPGTLTKTGFGAFILANANTHAGGTVLQSGTLVLASDTANTDGLGSGGVTLQGGTLRMYNNTSSYNTSSWPVVVPAGAYARWEADGRSTLAGTLSGAGTLDFYTPYIRTNITGNWSGFTGQLNVVSDSDGGELRLGNSAGLPSAWLHLGNFVSVLSRAGSGTTTFNIGALSGAISSVLNAGGGSGEGQNQPAHWRVGGLGLDSTFDGRFTGTSILTKVGAGTLTLTGASTHTGATTVSAGNLILYGGSFSGSNVTVQSGAGFGSNTRLTGNLTLQAGARLLLRPGATPLDVAGALTLGGTVTVAPEPGVQLQAGPYSLLTYTGTPAGALNFVWSGTGFAGDFDTSTPGLVRVTLRQTVTPPTALLALPDGSGRAALAWQAPANAVGYSVRRATSPGGPYATVATGLTALSFTDTGLTDGRTYHYVVAAVDADGGSADSDPVSVSVGESVPFAHWRLDEPSGATALDSAAGARHGSLVAAPARSAGRINNGLNLASGSAQHVVLPAGIVSSLNDFTLSLWVNPSSVTNWARLVDFGSGTNNYLFLSPRNGASGVVRFAIRTPSVPEQIIDGAAALPTGVWTHVAVTLSGGTGTLYVNGVAVGQNTAMTLTPASLGATTQNWLGRSQFAADPYLNGALDEVMLVARALTAAEVAGLAAPPSSPENFRVSPGFDKMYLGWTPASGATGYSVKRSATSDGPYETIADGVGANSYTDTGLSASTTYHYVVTARNGFAESADSAQQSATLPPPTPLGLVATPGDGQVSLSWDPEPTATSYSVLVPLHEGFATLITGLASTSYVVAGLENGSTYRFAVASANAGGQGAPSALVEVTPMRTLSPRETWRETHFGSSDPTGDAADTADPDADGVVNLLEYALGGDPLLANPGILPAASVTADHLALTFTRVADPGLTYRVQAVSELGASWFEIWISTGEENTDGPVTVTDAAQLSITPRRFLRLEVTAP